ncbi:MAG: hypothetical protein KF873_02110 [Gemmataceae bacterium]|nr:hypothetical protein [Gemmataceae bacterium]
MSESKTEAGPAFVRGGMILLPPAPHLCQECAVDHKPDEPHNAQSLYYQTKFRMEHGREATWSDALAHCNEMVRRHWLAELRKFGIPERLLGDAAPANYATAVTTAPSRKDGAR